MTSLERAKRFVQGKGRIIALTVVPLASLASLATPARASTSYTPTLCNVGAFGGLAIVSGGGSCFTDLIPGADGGTGVSVWGSGHAIVTDSGGSGTNMVLLFDARGDVDGTTPTTPVAWSFTNTFSGAGSFAWEISVAFNNTIVFDTTGALQPSVVGSTVLDTSTITFANYRVAFYVFDHGSFTGDTMSTNIPEHSSLDINDTPEPATFGMMASALAFLGSLLWWRRRSA